MESDEADKNAVFLQFLVRLVES